MRSCLRSPARTPSGSTPSAKGRFCSFGAVLRGVKYRVWISSATWPSYMAVCHFLVESSGKCVFMSVRTSSHARAALLNTSVDRPVSLTACLR